MPRRPVVITSILFASMWCAWAADVPVTGTVVDTTGAAIAGASVQLESANRTVLRTTESAPSPFPDFRRVIIGSWYLTRILKPKKFR